MTFVSFTILKDLLVVLVHLQKFSEIISMALNRMKVKLTLKNQYYMETNITKITMARWFLQKTYSNIGDLHFEKL